MEVATLTENPRQAFHKNRLVLVILGVADYGPGVDGNGVGVGVP